MVRAKKELNLPNAIIKRLPTDDFIETRDKHNHSLKHMKWFQYDASRNSRHGFMEYTLVTLAYDKQSAIDYFNYFTVGYDIDPEVVRITQRYDI